MTRPLRTTAVQRPRTQGQRIRFARVESGMSQQMLADAISAISRMKVSKSIISKWELDGVANPTNANILALQAVTGFTVDWFVKGGWPPQRVNVAKAGTIRALQPDLMAKALKAAAPGVDIDYDVVGRVMVQLYEILLDTPEVAPAVLQRFATTLRAAG